MALTPGLLLSDRYRLSHRIAIGGMGEVWAADDTRLARGIAVKVLRSELTSDPEFVDRFRAEARITASLNHSGIAAVYDYGEVASIAGGPRDTAYLVMELITGEPLSAVLARTGRLSVPRTLDVLEQSGRALQVAHARALVHRDIKPGNILITPTGQVKITDFGIAKVASHVPITRGGLVMGTAQYLSPEQAAGDKSFPPSDVYSLGVVAYECLAGVRPFRGENPLAVALAHVRDEPPPLPPDIPPSVTALVMRMLAKDPARRFPDGVSVARAVVAVRGGAAAFAPPARQQSSQQPSGQQQSGQQSGALQRARPPGPAPLTRIGAAVPLPAGPAQAVPGYAPPLRPPVVPARPPRTPYPAPVYRRTGIAVVIAVLVLVVVGIAGAIVITRTGAAGPGGADRAMPGNVGAARASVPLAYAAAVEYRTWPLAGRDVLGSAGIGGRSAEMGQFTPVQHAGDRRDDDEGRR